MKKNFILYLILCVFFSNCFSTLFANNDDQSEKIYIDSSSLLIIEEQLYLKQDGEILSIPALYSDENGLFILVLERPSVIKPRTCINGHDVYHNCGGCANWWCAFRCKCHSPW